MKYSAWILTAALALSACGQTSPTEWAKTIDAQVTQINAQLSEDSTVEKQVPGPEGGGTAVYYQKDGQNLKIEETMYVETAQSTWDFYYQNQELIAVQTKDTQYHTSIYEENFSQKDATSTEEKFYFKNGKLLEWLDSNGNKLDPSTAEFQKKERDILDEEKTLLAL